MSNAYKQRLEGESFRLDKQKSRKKRNICSGTDGLAPPDALVPDADDMAPSSDEVVLICWHFQPDFQDLDPLATKAYANTSLLDAFINFFATTMQRYSAGH